MHRVHCVNVHIVRVWGFSYLLIPGARSFADYTAVFRKIIFFRWIENLCSFKFIYLQISSVLSQIYPVRTLPRYFILISLLHLGFPSSFCPLNLWTRCLAFLLRRVPFLCHYFYIIILINYVKKFKLQTWKQYNFADVLPPIFQVKYFPQYPCLMKTPINIFLSR